MQEWERWVQRLTLLNMTDKEVLFVKRTLSVVVRSEF